MAKRRNTLALTVACTCTLCAPVTRSAGLAAPSGLKGEYFNGQWPYATAVVTRIDPEINFDWGEGPPAPGVNTDYFSVRWTGDLEAPLTGVYTFTLRTTDRVLLRIADKAVIGTAWPQSSVYEGTIELAGGQIYPLELVYEAGKGAASVQLLWQSSILPQEIVPRTVLQLPLRARTPSPADGATKVVQDTVLQWKAGCKATHHDIYFGDDANAVASATVATGAIYQGRRPFPAATFSPAPLEWDKTYYWRVDEVNDAEPSSPWKGPVWTFTTADFLLVDDFESYTDNEGERIYEIWIDGWDNGTGSTVGNTTTAQYPLGHTGKQSMPFDYNNAKLPWYSEAYRTWDRPQDWTVNGLTHGSLWVRGRPVPLVEKPDGGIILSTVGGYAWSARCFGYRQLTGDGQIVARVEAFKGAEGFVRAGVMIRETLDSDSKYAAIGIAAEQTLYFERRLAKTSSSVLDEQRGIAVPHWVKLIRKGDTMTAQRCADGDPWEDIVDPQGTPITVNIVMPKTVCIGLYLIGRSWLGAAAAEFSDITFTGNISAQWQVDSAWPGNSPDDLYVALEDTGGRVAVAMHPDPGVVNVGDWTQWRIPLSRFTDFGVNSKAIKRMYIGVGDRNSPQPGGSGVIWIDDIRVIRSLPPGPATSPGQALAVYPGHETVDTPQSLELHWLPGEEAGWHDVYFGDDAEVVAHATPASTGIYRGRQKLSETRFHPGLLDWNKSYFWRIDEVNDSHPASPWIGNVWTFTTADFLVLDDFESYIEEEGWRLYEWWIEGWSWTTGWSDPFVFPENSIVRSGRQAMALDYNNVKVPFHTWVEYWWAPAQDWTINGLDTLVLYVRGAAANDLQPLYVVVEDSTFKSVLVTYPDSQIARATEWNEWKIPLSGLTGVNLTKVKRMYIGVGDRRNLVPGGTGTIYVDDIRVIRSTAVP